MGSGYAKSSYYTAPHWDGTENKTANYIDIEFDVLINHHNNKLLDKTALNEIDSKGVQQWFPQQSGISIKNEFIENLESKWFEFISKYNLIGQSYFSNDVTVDISETFIEGKAKEVTQTRYERNPRARKLCLDYHGYSCHICDFNFEQVFGEIGKGFIHVHHINPISGIGKEYAVDFINDLIPVCPNCHSMIHAKRPAFSIDEIKTLLKRKV